MASATSKARTGGGSFSSRKDMARRWDLGAIVQGNERYAYGEKQAKRRIDQRI